MTQATYGDPRLTERFWSKVQIAPSGCWLWTRAKRSGGYGIVRIDKQLYVCHRLTYSLLVGAIPPGLDLDHLCRVRNCCRPDHLEPVTRRENSLRGMSPAIVTWRTDVCKRGHSMADAYVRPDGARRCRTCGKEDNRMAAERYAQRITGTCPACRAVVAISVRGYLTKHLLPDGGVCGHTGRRPMKS